MINIVVMITNCAKIGRAMCLEHFLLALIFQPTEKCKTKFLKNLEPYLVWLNGLNVNQQTKGSQV